MEHTPFYGLVTAGSMLSHDLGPKELALLPCPGFPSEFNSGSEFYLEASFLGK